MGNRISYLAAAFAAVFLLAAPSAQAQTQGGTATVALYHNITSMDPHFFQAQAGRSIIASAYEGLVAIDDDAQVIPMLAKSWTVSEDGLVYTFVLRPDVKFHNGKVMTSADVKASLERVARVGTDPFTMQLVQKIDTPSPTEVVITLKSIDRNFLNRLASPVHPASIIPAEEAGKELNKTANIGTGPFKIVEWVPDSYIKVEKFADYTQDPDFDGPKGLGGKKTVHLDSVTFKIVSEASARVAALEAGEVQIAQNLPAPAAARLKANPDLTVHELKNFNMAALFINHAAPPTNNLKFRQALQAALDLDQIMAGGTDGLYELDHSWLWAGHPLYSDSGKELYNINNMEEGKKLLAESGYNGEPIKFAIPTIDFHMKIGAVVLEQLRELGLNIEPISVDYPTLVSIINKDDGWNLATNGFSSHPLLGGYSYRALFDGAASASRKIDPSMEAAWNTYNTSLNDEERKKAWSEIQRITYEDVLMLKLGNQSFLVGTANKLKGYNPHIGAERMWDVWID